MTDLYDLGDRAAARRRASSACTPMPSARTASASRATPGSAKSFRRRRFSADEVLIYVMASGINFNNVWAALGTPLDVIAERQRLGEPEDFHAGGSDCSGIVWATGHGRHQRQRRRRGHRPQRLVASRRSVGARRQGSDARGEHAHLGLPDQLRQLLPVRAGAGAPVRAEAAGAHVGGGRLLSPLRARPPIACSWAGRRTSSSAATSCSSGGRRRPRQHGARYHARRRRPRRGGDVRRSQARVLPGARRRRRDQPAAVQSLGPDAGHRETARPTTSGSKGARAFGKAIWEALGEQTQSADRVRAPRRGHAADVGLRLRDRRHGRHLRRDDRLQRHARPAHHWMRQKRFQGSHLSNDEQAAAVDKLVDAGAVVAEPVVDVSVSTTFPSVIS